MISSIYWCKALLSQPFNLGRHARRIDWASPRLIQKQNTRVPLRSFVSINLQGAAIHVAECRKTTQTETSDPGVMKEISDEDDDKLSILNHRPKQPE